MACDLLGNPKVPEALTFADSAPEGTPKLRRSTQALFDEEAENNALTDGDAAPSRTLLCTEMNSAVVVLLYATTGQGGEAAP